MGTIKRKTPVKRVNRDRKKREFERAYHSRERVEWVKSLPCAACGVVGYSENAHIRTGGMGRKADYKEIAPLCANRFNIVWCHAQLHLIGREYFEVRYGVDLDVCASSTHQAWMEYKNDR